MVLEPFRYHTGYGFVLPRGKVILKSLKENVKIKEFRLGGRYSFIVRYKERDIAWQELKLKVTETKISRNNSRTLSLAHARTHTFPAR